MMGRQNSRFKRSLATALGALLFALVPAIAPGQALGASGASGGSDASDARVTSGASPAVATPSEGEGTEAARPADKETPRKARAGREKGKKAAAKPSLEKGEKVKTSAKKSRKAPSAKKSKEHAARKSAAGTSDSKLSAAAASNHDAPPSLSGATHAASNGGQQSKPSDAPSTSPAQPHKDHEALAAPEKAGSSAPHASNPSRPRASGNAATDAKAASKHARKSVKETGKKKVKKTAARASSAKRRPEKKASADKEAPRRPCFGPAVSLDRSGLEAERFPLVDCAGAPIEEARERLSVLARPWGVARPEIAPAKSKKAPSAAASKGARAADPLEIAPGVRRLDKGLLARVNAIAQRFSGKAISVVSGYRPQSRGSLHQTARAVDLRVAGVANEDLVAFCKTLSDTGCGYYPNSSFIHVDVRLPGTGSVSWIDASGPGEPPRYVTQWPPPPPEEPPPFVPSVGASTDVAGHEPTQTEAVTPKASAQPGSCDDQPARLKGAHGAPLFEDPPD